MSNEGNPVDNRPSKPQKGTPNFMPRMDMDTLCTLLPIQRERVAKLLPSTLLFGDEVRQISAIYPELRSFLNKRGATIQSTTRKIVRQLARGLYDEAKERELADRLAQDIQKGRTTMPADIPVVQSADMPRHPSDRTAHNVAMRLKYRESKFAGDTMECWDESADNYRQIARDYGLLENQKLQFLHNILTKDAKRFYLANVAPHVATFQQALDMTSTEYNSPVRQTRIKNYLHGLRLNTFVAKGMEVAEALAKIYRTIQQLSTQCPTSHKGDAHKTEFLRAAVISCEWAKEPLSRVATHQLTYQTLYGELESALQLQKEYKLEQLRDRATNPTPPLDNKIASINYTGQPKFRRGNPVGQKAGAHKSPLDIQGCFNCDSPSHMAKDCPRALNLARAAAKKMEYFNKKRRDNAVHLVLADLCRQLDEGEGGNEVNHTDDAKIFVALFEEKQHQSGEPDKEILDGKEAEILEATIDLGAGDGSDEFLGICVDSGAQCSIVGLLQAKAYMKKFGGRIRKHGKGRTYRFGDVRHASVGTLTTRIPVSQTHLMDLSADVVDVNVSFLLGLDALTQLSAILNVGKNTISSQTTDWELPLVRKNGHLYICWPTEVLFTTSELKKLHRHLFHTNPTRIFDLLKRADTGEVDGDDLTKLEKITKECDVCQRLATAPNRFCVSIPNPSCIFNRDMCLDLMKFEGRTVIHTVDKDTKFSAARFLSEETAGRIWDTFVEMWSNSYAGQPKILSYDEGPKFTSQEWKSVLSKYGIKTRKSGVESHNALGVGERYHHYLRQVYERVKMDTPKVDSNLALSIAVKVCNYTVGIAGLSPTLLIFGVVPRLPIVAKDLPDQVQRMQAIRGARRELTRLISHDRVKTALLRNVPAAADAEIIEGTEVLMFREKPIGQWVGPFVVNRREEKMLTLDTGERMIDASIDKVKPYYKSHTSEKGDAANLQSTTDDKTTDEKVNRLLDQYLPTNTGNHEYEIDTFVVKRLKPTDEQGEKENFVEAKRVEVEGLMKRGIWEVCSCSDIRAGSIVMGGRFELTLKNYQTPEERAKVRFVAQGYDDRDKPFLVHDTSTLRFSSIRIILSSASWNNFNLFSHDVTQAYLQSKQRLSRDIYIKIKPNDREVFGINDRQVLKLLKPLHGLCDAGDYWGIAIQDHITEDLLMEPTIGDPAMFVRKKDGKLIGITGAYVDDLLNAGTKEFENITNAALERFESKPRVHKSFDCYGAQVGTTPMHLKVSQSYYVHNLTMIDTTVTFNEFRKHRALLSWVTNTRPNLAYRCNNLSQVTAQTYSKETVKVFNDGIRVTQKHKNVGLRYKTLDHDTTHIRCYTDTSFGNNDDLSSQIGFLVLLCDNDGNSHFLDYRSRKSRRVVRSAMAAEMYAFAEGFDAAYLIARDLEETQETRFDIFMSTDSLKLFDAITQGKRTEERRLMTDVFAARQSYKKFEITGVGHIDGASNPADKLTKLKHNGVLDDIFLTGQMDRKANVWIDRSGFPMSLRRRKKARSVRVLRLAKE